jgi:hypothetical protein
MLAAEPSLTRQALRDRLGLSVDVRTIGPWLRKLGLPTNSKASLARNGSRAA